MVHTCPPLHYSIILAFCLVLHREGIRKITFGWRKNSSNSFPPLPPSYTLQKKRMQTEDGGQYQSKTIQWNKLSIYLSQRWKKGFDLKKECSPTSCSEYISKTNDRAKLIQALTGQCMRLCGYATAIYWKGYVTPGHRHDLLAYLVTLLILRSAGTGMSIVKEILWLQDLLLLQVRIKPKIVDVSL